jgi:indole-3-glycerol phosphate synthase
MFLDDAVEAAKLEMQERMRKTHPAALDRMISEGPVPPDFRTAITRGEGGAVKVIAEVKRSSPSAGDINKSATVSQYVSAYREAGASAVSVLTSAHKFGGDVADLRRAARYAAGVPLLRKDFIVEPYQVMEARAFGASAVLLISAAMPRERLKELVHFASSLQMFALVETHSADDLRNALESGSQLIGINNRDLATLEVDIHTTERLLPLIPEGFLVVSESGIKTRKDIQYLEALGIDAVLIGEALMRAQDPAAKLREFLGAPVAGSMTSSKEVDESCGSRSVE